MNTKRKRAQSILEYVIAVTVIIAGVMAASGYLRSKVGGGVNAASDSIFNSLSGNPSIGGGSGNTTNPTNTTNPPGPTTPVALGALPIASKPEQIGTATIYVPLNTVTPYFTNESFLRQHGIVISYGTRSSVLEGSSTGYLTADQQGLIYRYYDSYNAGTLTTDWGFR